MADHAVGRTGVGLVVGWGDPAVTGAVDAGGLILPTGTVAFLLTDVEASTQLWEAEPELMAKAMERHDQILDEAVSARGGVRPAAQGEGDSIVAAFPRASDAVLAAVDAQRALTKEAWPTSTPLRIRMAVHAGEARTASDGNYAGQTIIRTARLRAIAHGGQVLVSEPARDLVVDNLGDRVRLLDLGEHRLRDLARPERVHQVMAVGLVDAFGPLKSLDAHSHNLPVQLSSFIGRVEEIAAVTELVRTNRLVTVVGGGGAGKTRLAMQVAAESVGQRRDGTWWVELQDITEARYVVPAIAAAVGATGEVKKGAADALARSIADRQLFLLIDNCEHLIERVASVVDQLLRGCPGLRVLATSREALNVPGEVAWAIPPLRCPESDEPVPISVLSQYDSVRLFLDRAQRVRPGFAVDGDNAPAIAAICARLDGVPLAIELAAARCRAMTAGQILAALSDSFGLLRASTRGVLPRHATLEALITWSHDLLTAPEQVLLRRLAVFGNGCTLDAAETVCSDDEEMSPLAVLDILERLVAQSLVLLDDACDPPRYRLPETIRVYAARKLVDAGETDEVRDRHLDFYFGFLDRAWPLTARATSRAIAKGDIESELDNAILALDRAAKLGRWQEYTIAAIQTCIPLAEFLPHLALDLLGRVPEEELERDRRLHADFCYLRAGCLAGAGDPRALAERHRAVELAGDGVLPEVVALAAAEAPLTARTREDAVALLAEASAFARALNDPDVRAFQLGAAMCVEMMYLGDLAAGLRDLAEFERVRDAMTDDDSAALGELYGAVVCYFAGDLDRAARLHARAERLLAARRPRARSLVPRVSWHLAMAKTTELHIAIACDDVDEAQVRGVLASLELARRLHQVVPNIALCLTAAASELRFGNPAAALNHCLEAETICQAIGDHADRMLASSNAVSALIMMGDVNEARRRLATLDDEPALTLSPLAAAIVYCHRAVLAHATHDPSARSLARSALEHAHTHGYRLVVVDVLELSAILASDHDDHREVARLIGAIDRTRHDIGYHGRWATLGALRDVAIDRARQVLGDSEFDTALGDGQRLSLDEAVAYVLRGNGDRGHGSTGWESLTSRERSVVDEVRRGHTNRQISHDLLMSPDTVKTHLSHIYAKLGVANRTELAAQARTVAGRSQPE